MNYKVISNNGIKHNFAIGTIITLIVACIDASEGVFASVDEPGNVQAASMSDVEPLVLSKQDAAAKLSAMVSEINRSIARAEVVANEHGLDFSLNVSYGMGGTFYGTGNENVDKWTAAGWNPSSQSC